MDGLVSYPKDLLPRKGSEKIRMFSGLLPAHCKTRANHTHCIFWSLSSLTWFVVIAACHQHAWRSRPTYLKFQEQIPGTQNSHASLKKQMSIFCTVVSLHVQKTAQPPNIKCLGVLLLLHCNSRDSKKDMLFHFSNSPYIQNRSWMTLRKSHRIKVCQKLHRSHLDRASNLSGTSGKLRMLLKIFTGNPDKTEN